MTTPTTTTIEHRIGANGSVTLKVASGGVTVHGVDGDTVRLSSPTGRDLTEDYRLETGDGRLELTTREGLSSGFGWLTGRRFDPIHADVPHGAAFHLDTASGSVEVDGLCGEQRYRAASGSIELSDVAGDITVDHVSGDVRLRASGTLSLVARTVSGDVSASAPAFEKIQARMMSGGVRIAGRLVGDGPFAIDTVSGDVSLELDGPARVEGTSVAGNVRTDLPHRDGGSPGRRTVEIGDRGPRVTFKTVSGDLRVTGLKAAPVDAATATATAPAAAPAAAPEPGPVEAALDAVDRADHVGAALAAVATPEPAAEPATDLAARRLAILQDLEVGRIEVDQAAARLAEIDTEEDQARTHSRTFGIGPLHGELRWDHHA